MPPETNTGYDVGRMQGFVASLLRESGALVDAIDPEGLEVLAPEPVQQALGVGEFCRLGFGPAMPATAQRVGIEGDWLDRFGRLLGENGRRTRHVLQAPARGPGDPERLLERELTLDNATWRLLGVRPAWTRYLAMDFRASAVSDEKRDFVLRLALNLATGALPDAVLAALTPTLDDANPDEMGTLPEDVLLPEMWERGRILKRIDQALTPRLNTALSPFIKGMRRRLGRDQDRLYRYHNELHRETLQRVVALPESDPKRRREEQRAEAIGREYRAKIDDITRQYATRVSVQWMQTLEVVMPVHRIQVQVRRRKAERVLELDWNPLARKLESPPCEATFSTERPRLVCDDALHLVVPAALGPCTSCGRAFCRACHPERCPKCGTPKSELL